MIWVQYVCQEHVTWIYRRFESFLSVSYERNQIEIWSTTCCETMFNQRRVVWSLVFLCPLGVHVHVMPYIQPYYSLFFTLFFVSYLLFCSNVLESLVRKIFFIHRQKIKKKDFFSYSSLKCASDQEINTYLQLLCVRVCDNLHLTYIVYSSSCFNQH